MFILKFWDFLWNIKITVGSVVCFKIDIWKIEIENILKYQTINEIIRFVKSLQIIHNRKIILFPILQEI